MEQFRDKKSVRENSTLLLEMEICTLQNLKKNLLDDFVSLVPYEHRRDEGFPGPGWQVNYGVLILGLLQKVDL